MMAENNVPRRNFLKGAGATGVAAATALAGGLPRPAEAQTAIAQSAAPTPEPLLTLTADEAAFFSAVYDTIIPADRLSPSGTDCGCVTYIDRQLAGAWGNGAKLYRNGPFLPAKPHHGYQLPLTPREYFAAGIKAANAWTAKTYGKSFDRLSAADRNAAMTAMEKGEAKFEGFDAQPFFEALLQSAMEGFFADPMYGGNRNKASWRMVGYPGLPATWGSKAEALRGKKIAIEPQSIADFS
ncbi:MAG TPA: gluconate 2-dehydrogenase subunit 3 family protein [Micropepsaceae bacterium]|jgi:gluconate 2-dehydrogenase gamma chain|nr:gluconate 2-dehydrogenase subunit 3 family protein [Micropepsaceae bacterium]